MFRTFRMNCSKWSAYSGRESLGIGNFSSCVHTPLFTGGGCRRIVWRLDGRGAPSGAVGDAVVLDSHFDRSEGRRLQIAAKGDNTMYICSYTSIYLCTYAYINIYICTYIHVWMLYRGCWILILIGVKAEDCKSLPKVITQCISVAIHLYLYVHMHTWIYICTHMHVWMAYWAAGVSFWLEWRPKTANRCLRWQHNVYH